ncbi:MAG: VOC family protein [Bacteroidota bacterium]
MHPFQLDTIDHVAIRVSNMEASAKWYAQVLGFQRATIPAWEPFPVFLLSGSFGIALFPANEKDPVLPQRSLNIKIDHFAFRVHRSAFDQALQHYEALGLTFVVKDHTYFLSVYTDDPDGHTVELTTPIKALPD